MAGRAGTAHYRAELQESAEEKAQRLVREELKHLGWTEMDLVERRKGDLKKIKLARRLR